VLIVYGIPETLVCIQLSFTHGRLLYNTQRLAYLLVLQQLCGSFNSGYGGHVKATKSFTKNTTFNFWVYCGGGGGSDFQGTGGGWNGGGHAGNTGASGGGGGATLIATNNTGSSSWTGGDGDGRILVAGGGGGASNGNYGGGDGGASDSGDNTGTWEGQNKAIDMNGSTYRDGGGGGAGYVGGVYGGDNEGGGHGGSNYVASGWEIVINDTSGNTIKWGHTVNGSSASYSNENHTLYPGYVIVTFKYE